MAAGMKWPDAGPGHIIPAAKIGAGKRSWRLDKLGLVVPRRAFPNNQRRPQRLLIGGRPALRRGIRVQGAPGLGAGNAIGHELVEALKGP